MMLMDGIQVTFEPAGLLARAQASANATVILSSHRLVSLSKELSKSSKKLNPPLS